MMQVDVYTEENMSMQLEERKFMLLVAASLGRKKDIKAEKEVVAVL